MIMMFHATVKGEHVSRVEDAVKTLFTALDHAEPQGIRYGSYRLADSDTYIIMLELKDEAENPLLGIAEFRAFQDSLKEWLAEPAIPERLSTVGEYRSF